MEALASTKLNMLLDVVFTKEVGEAGAVYFSKESGSSANLIHEVEQYSQEQINELSNKAKE